MDTVIKPMPHIEKLVPYDPQYLVADVMLSANESPYDIPPEVRFSIEERIKTLSFNRYPDPLAQNLRNLIAESYGVNPEQVLLGNGGDELLFNIALAWGGFNRTYLDVPPTFSVYSYNAGLTGTTVVQVPRQADFAIDRNAILDRVAQDDIDFLIINSPNNPTGQSVNNDFIEELLNSTQALVVVDEAYGEFSSTSAIPLLEKHTNLVILRTFSKAFSLAGVRLGYVLGSEEVIAELIKVRQPYSVDALSQVIGESAFEQRMVFQPFITSITKQRTQLMAELRTIPEVEAFDSDANYILFRVEDAHQMWDELYKRSILIRNFASNPLLTNCLRVTVGSPEENRSFLEALKEILAARRNEQK